MNRKIFVFIVVVLFLSGCGKLGKEKEPFKDAEIHKGGVGLYVGFLENMPPREIVEGSPFIVGVELRNIGATDIKKCYLTLDDIDKEYFSILDDEIKNFSLKGKSLSTPEGEYKVMTFSLENKKPAEEEDKQFFFSVLSCYDYKTSAVTEICLNPVSLEGAKIESDVCTIQDIMPSSQGAPVAVSKIQENILFDKDTNKNKVFLSININNVGGGAVTTRENYEDICTGLAPKESELKEIEIEANLAGEEMECRKTEQNKETPNQIIIVCSALLDIEESYITMLKVDMIYGYVTKEIGRTMKVKKITLQPSCDPDNCKLDEWGVCDPVYGIEDAEKTPSCPENMKCCSETITECEREYEDYECLPADDCDLNEKVDYKCPGSLKCCKRKYIGMCKGSCVDTEGWNSCEAYGGDSEGTCSDGKMCCAQTNPECMTEHSGNYNDEIGNYYCVLQSEMGIKYDCIEIIQNKCPGTGSVNKKCCLIESKADEGV